MTKQDKVAKVMHEWKAGTLTSNGKVVTDYDQAVAIALSEAGLSKYAKGGWVLYDEDDERLIKVYETESEARKNLYEYEGNANIVEKSSWDNNQYAVGGGIEEEVPLRADIDGDIYEVIGVNHKLNKVRAKDFSSGDVIEMPIDNWYKESFEFGTQAKFKANGREYVGMVTMKDGQKSISLYNDENYSGDAERIVPFNKIDLKTLKSTMEKETFSKGGNIIERRYVNKDQDYETRYAKNRPSRMGYKDERKFEGGGGIKKYYDVFYSIKGGGSMIAKNIEASSEEEAKEKLTKQMRASSTFDKPIAAIQKFAVGGEIGNQVTFSRYGERTTGRVTDKLKNGYEVVTDEGTILVEPQEVISFSDEPIAKKKRFGFFAGGGSVESKKQAILDFINSFPDKPKDWSEATDDLPELHHDIAEQYGSKYDFDFNKRSSLRDRNLRHKQHAKSLLNKLSDEEISNVYSKWEETLEDKFAGGGSVESLLEQRKELLEELINSDIIDEEHGYYDDVRNAIKSNDSEQMREIIDELLSSGLIYKDDWDYRLARKLSKEGRKFEGGGEIENKIEKLKKVVSSKMLPESVKAKAQAEIDKLEKELHESKEKKGIPQSHLDLKSKARSKVDVLSFDDWMKENGITFYKRTYYWVADDGGADYMYSGEYNDVKKSLKNDWEQYKLAKLNVKMSELHESKETKAEEKAEHKVGGKEYKSKLEENLLKELHRLRADLTKDRLSKYNEGDNSEEAKALERERKSKITRMNEVLAVLNQIHESKEENKMTGESEGERKAGMDEEKDYIEAKTKALEKSLKDKTISETQRKRDEKELALFKGAEAKKPTTRKAPVRKASVKKAVAKKVEVKKEPKFKVGEFVLASIFSSGNKGLKFKVLESKFEKDQYIYKIYLEGEGTHFVSEHKLEIYKPAKADHKKLVAKLKAKKGDKEYDNRASLVPFTDKRRERSESSDKKREALPLGKRISADGNKYYENRLNRADISKKDKFEDGGEVKGSGWGLNLNW